MFRNPLIDAIVVLLVVLLIFGPKRLPQLGKSLGHGMREFKDGITGDSKVDDDEERPELTQASRFGAGSRGPRSGASPPRPRRLPSPRRPPRSARRSAAPSRAARGAGVTKALRPIGHEDRLSIVDHLDELRTRLVICLVGVAGRVRGLLLAEQRAAERPEPGAAARLDGRRRSARARVGAQPVGVAAAGPREDRLRRRRARGCAGHLCRRPRRRMRRLRRG